MEAVNGVLLVLYRGCALWTPRSWRNFANRGSFLRLTREGSTLRKSVCS